MDTKLDLRDEIIRAVDILREEGVIAFPTDTLYGLGADVFSVRAIQRVFDIKHRTGDMGLPILISSLSELDLVATGVSDTAMDMANRYWPGPLSLVLKKSPDVPLVLSGGRDTVAVRMPNHSVPTALVHELGRPITGTSANPSGGRSTETAEDVRRTLGDRVDYILDGGPSTLGTPSTIVDVTGPVPRLIRPGAIPWESLAARYQIAGETAPREVAPGEATQGRKI